MNVPEIEINAARAGYEAYCDYTGGKSLVSGDLLPSWDELKPEIRNAWHAAGKAIRNASDLPAIGSPLAGGFFGGEMTINGERYALIVAPKAEGEKTGDDELQYKISDRSTADGTDSDNDGMANTDRINDANHPAAQFCRGLQIGGFDDWYLPSRDELAMLCRNLGPNRKGTPEQFRADAPEAFEEAWYWSSTEYASDSNGAWVVCFDDGSQYDDNKSSYYGVRAVRRLKL